MMWDASQAYANSDFIGGVKSALKAPAATAAKIKTRAIRRARRQPWWT